MHIFDQVQDKTAFSIQICIVHHIKITIHLPYCDPEMVYDNMYTQRVARTLVPSYSHTFLPLCLRTLVPSLIYLIYHNMISISQACPEPELIFSKGAYKINISIIVVVSNSLSVGDVTLPSDIPLYWVFLCKDLNLHR